jgi:hypothetical protein
MDDAKITTANLSGLWDFFVKYFRIYDIRIITEKMSGTPLSNTMF